MIRFILLLLAVIAVYSAIRTVVRSAFTTLRGEERQHGRRIMGNDMVQDPECRTYVVKDRAVTRRIRGTLIHFCSDDCARRYEDRNRA